jgi:hypothetical protein
MSKAKRDLREALKNNALHGEKFYSVLCDVVSVNGLFCKVQPQDETSAITNVRLTPQDVTSDFILIPEVGSSVVVDFLDKKHAIISMVSQVSAIRLKGDEYGGLIIIEELVTKLNNLESDINDLKQVFSSWTPIPNDGGAALKGSVSSWAAATLTESKVNDLENPDVTHG